MLDSVEYKLTNLNGTYLIESVSQYALKVKLGVKNLCRWCLKFKHTLYSNIFKLRILYIRNNPYATEKSIHFKIYLHIAELNNLVAAVKLTVFPDLI